MKRMWKWIIALVIVLVAVTILSGCKKSSNAMEKAKEMKRAALSVTVLIDNTASFKPSLDISIKEMLRIFQKLAKNHGETRVSVVLIAQQPDVIYSGRAAGLQKAFDEIQARVKGGQSSYTNLSAAVEYGLDFAARGDARRNLILVFSDLQHSMPDYYPLNYDVVPPPKNFPWATFHASNTEIVAFYVPYVESKVWQTEIKGKGLEKRFSILTPPELKDRHISDIYFSDKQ